MRPFVFAAWLVASIAGQAAEIPAAPELYLKAIRANDLVALRSMGSVGLAGVHDSLDWTPLHYAALYGSTEAVRVLLSAGANPNARNRAGATPLLYAAYDFDKTRLMVEKGGDVAAKANDGSTVLWVAAGAANNTRTVQYLVEKGANPSLDLPRDADLLMRASERGDAQLVQFLLGKGVSASRSSKGGETAIDDAVGHYPDEKVAILLAAGAKVNVKNTFAGSVRNGPIESTGVTPLMDAAALSDIAAMNAILKAGAQVNAQDDRKMTALMMAVATDRPEAAKVRRLIDSGADVNIADRNGETALDWARKFGNQDVIGILVKAGAKEKGLAAAPVKPTGSKPDAKEAVERASKLLAKSSEDFFREGGGCLGCHHQPFAGRAFAALKAEGGNPEPRLRRIFLDGVIADRARELNIQPLLNTGGGGYDGGLYQLVAMAELGELASDITDAMTHMIAVSQQPSGVWTLSGSRPPLQESDITSTRMAIQVLKAYGWPARKAEFDARIANAAKWLLAARGYTTLDEADRLAGLWIAGQPLGTLRAISAKLLAMQRADGGWGQSANLDSDAFGTAAALVSLRMAGALKSSDPAYRKGVDFLLSTQFPDGAWYVRSRAVKLQPYFEATFPFGHDQWISASATAYAVMALAPMVAPASR